MLVQRLQSSATSSRHSVRQQQQPRRTWVCCGMPGYVTHHIAHSTVLIAAYAGVTNIATSTNSTFMPCVVRVGASASTYVCLFPQVRAVADMRRACCCIYYVLCLLGAVTALKEHGHCTAQ